MLQYALIVIILLLDVVLGLTVLLNNTKSKNNRIFFWLTLFAFIWILSNFLENESFLEQYSSTLLRIDFASAIIVSYFFLLFCLAFPRPGRSPMLKEYIFVFPALVLYILSFSSLIIKNVKFADGAIQFSRGALYWPYALLLIGYVGGGCISLITKTRRLKGIEKIQAFYILLGLALAMLVAIPINLILTQLVPLSVDVSRVGVYSALFFIIFTAYAILKHHLFNIKVIATELSTLAICIILLMKMLLSEGPSELTFNIVIFVAVIIFGIFLVRSVTKEVQQREELERLNKEIEKAYAVERRANEELKKIDNLKNQFLMQVQHDMRTPLTIIMGYCDLLIGGSFGKQSGKAVGALKKIQTVVEGKLKDVNDFLDVSQFQLGKKVVSLKPGIELNSILEGIVNGLSFSAESKGIYLKFEKPKKMLIVEADREKLKSALFNIVDNSIKYTTSGGVSIKTESNGSIKIIVSDTGIGIPQEKIKTLFDTAFERGEQAKRTFTAGMGVGLYLSSQIIKAHNGKLWAESAGHGKGATFYVELPIGATLNKGKSTDNG